MPTAAFGQQGGVQESRPVKMLKARRHSCKHTGDTTDPEPAAHSNSPTTPPLLAGTEKPLMVQKRNDEDCSTYLVRKTAAAASTLLAVDLGWIWFTATWQR